MSPRRCVLVLVVAMASAWGAAPAGAATLSVEGTTITLQAAPGEKNFVTVNWGNNPSVEFPSIDENSVDIVPGPGCAEYVVGFQCPSAGRKPTFVLRLGDGDDIARSTNSEAVGTTTQMFGEAGNDRLQSQAGSDLLDGGPGDDELQPDDGESSPGDVLRGGEGTDLLQLISSLVPAVTATLDGVADDGGAGEGDNYAPDFENITGSRVAANTIVGTPGPNVILGADLADNLSGGGGDDRIEGRDANDRIDGGDGADRLVGDSGDDLIIGGGGVDSIDGDGIGGFGQVVAGNDRIEARDGLAESINCGLASDTAIIDQIDTVPTDPTTACENVDRGTATPGPGTTPAAAAKVQIRSTSLRYRDGRIAIAIRCPASTAACRGTLRVRTVSRVRLGSSRRIVTILSTRYSVDQGKSRTVRLRPGTSGRSLLRRTRLVSVRVELRPGGKGSPITKTLRLRR